MFCRAARGVRDGNLKARALAGAESSRKERKTRTHRERTRSILELSGNRRTIALRLIALGTRQRPCRLGRWLCCHRGANIWRIQRGHGLFTATGMDLLRTLMGSWTVRGCGLDADTNC
jgi:hypothetical protein